MNSFKDDARNDQDYEINPHRKSNEDSKLEIHLFYPKNLSLDELCRTRRNIRTLVIIGVRDVSSMNAIVELINLQELWIVECGIKEVPDFQNNCQLEKLCLYSNELECVPNLEHCLRLKSLLLSGNNICNLTNLNILTWLEELNLANNKFDSLNAVFSKKCELRNINLAGNYLCCIKDIKNLAVLQKLDSLVFVDPLYGECPLAFLCNYRFGVINGLSRIKTLDHYSISKGERIWVHHIFQKQIKYHNMIMHNHLNLQLALLKEKFKQYQRSLLHFKKQLYALRVVEDDKCSDNSESNESKNILKQIELDNKQFLNWKELEIIHSKVLKIYYQQLILSINYFGNISFVEYNADTENSVIRLCQKILEESLCPIIINTTDLKGVKLYKVTKVIHKEICCLNRQQNEDSDLQLNTHDMVLKILVSPSGVADIRKWPFNFFETKLFTKKKILLTDCLAVADSKWLNEVFLAQKNTNESNEIDIFQKRRLCVLIQAPITTQIEKVNEVDTNHINCQRFTLTNKEIRNPIFVIEYEYLLEDITKIDLDENQYESSTANATLPKNKSNCLSTANITRYLDRKEEIVHNLKKICISHQNINTLATNIDLPNLMEFDISYNQLETFPTATFLKTIKILNISFNNIQSLCAAKVPHVLQDLNISWNSLNNCLRELEILARFMPKIYKLNICYNPFQDIIDQQLVDQLISTYLPNVRYINEKNVYDKSFTLPNNYFLCAFNMCKPLNKQRNNFVNLTQDVIKDMKEYKMKCVKYVHVSCGSFSISNLLKEVPNVQELCSAYCLLTKFPITLSLKRLTKLNLAGNMILTLDKFTQEKLPALKYFDLTNNFITTLKPMGTFYTLREFYCGHNMLSSLSEMDNLQSWRMLHLLDLSNNPIDKDTFYKKFILFHLNNIKCLSGEYVQISQVIEARYALGNILDKDILNSIYKTDRLTNITQLSVVDCSLSKVDLCANALPHLESLDLSKNQLTSLKGLTSLKSLQTLCLSYNSFECLDQSTESCIQYSLPTLCTLFLDHNNLKSLGNVMKEKFPAMKHLFLNHNYLKSIIELNQWPTLETLVLDYNEIEEVHEKDFCVNNSIKFLSLESNKIKTLQFIKSLKNLEKLYIANNYIAKETELLHSASLENLKELSFEGNPLSTTIESENIILQGFDLRNSEA